MHEKGLLQEPGEMVTLGGYSKEEEFDDVLRLLSNIRDDIIGSILCLTAVLSKLAETIVVFMTSSGRHVSSGKSKNASLANPPTLTGTVSQKLPAVVDKSRMFKPIVDDDIVLVIGEEGCLFTLILVDKSNGGKMWNLQKG